MAFNLAAQVQTYISDLEERGVITRTFRRLDYPRQITLLKSVLAEALDSGPSSINVKNVARRAGISVGSLYQYFGNREHMLECVFDLSVHISRDFCEKLSSGLAGIPIEQALASYVKQVLDIGREEPALVILWSKAAYEGDPSISDRWVKPISAAIRKLHRSILLSAMDKGELRRDIDLDIAISALDALTAAFFDSHFEPRINAYFGMSREGSSPSEDWSRLSRILMFGISVPENLNK